MSHANLLATGFSRDRLPTNREGMIDRRAGRRCKRFKTVLSFDSYFFSNDEVSLFINHLKRSCGGIAPIRTISPIHIKMKWHRRTRRSIASRSPRLTSLGAPVIDPCAPDTFTRPRPMKQYHPTSTRYEFHSSIILDRIHLSIVQEVEKLGSLTAAASVLHMTQSALSHSMKMYRPSQTCSD